MSSRFRRRSTIALRSTVAPCRRLSGLTAIAIVLVGSVPCRVLAEEAALAGVEASQVPAAGPLSIDANLLLAKPTALGPGLSTGFGIGVTRGRTLAWEARRCGEQSRTMRWLWWIADSWQSGSWCRLRATERTAIG